MGSNGMTPLEAKQAFEDGNTTYNFYHIKVRTKSGAEYRVCRDILEQATSDWSDTDGYVYGERTNGVIGRGPFGRSTQGQLKWFNLKNVTLVKNETC